MTYLCGTRKEELIAAATYLQNTRKDYLAPIDDNMEEYSKSIRATWGNPLGNWSVISASGLWVHVIYKIIPSSTGGNGKLSIDVECMSGSTAAIAIMKASTFDGTALPDLTGDTSGSSFTAGQTRTLLGTSVTSLKTGYFAIETGFAAHSISVRINAVNWVLDGGAGTINIWNYSPSTPGTYIHGTRKEA